MKSKLTLGAVLALFALVSTSASAAVIVDYAMTTVVSPSSGSLSLLPTVTDTNVTAPALVNQSGGTASGSNNYNGGTDRVSIWNTTNSDTTTTYAGAFAGNNYVTFSITPSAGYQMDLTSITFQAAAATSTTTTNRAFYLVTASSLAGFTSSSTVLSTDRTSVGGGTMPFQAATATNTVPQDYTVDLTSFAGLTTVQYFRFYLQTPTISQGLAFDDIIVNGTVSLTAVPEPSTYACLVGAVALGLVGVRRRRR